MEKLAFLTYDSLLITKDSTEFIFDSFYNSIYLSVYGGYTRKITEEMKTKFYNIRKNILGTGSTATIVDSISKGDSPKGDTGFAANGTQTEIFSYMVTQAEFLNGLKKTNLLEYCDGLEYRPGAKEFIRELKNRGYYVVVISEGFSVAVSRVIDDLGVDLEFSNELEITPGDMITGRVGGPILFYSSKGKLIKKLQKIKKVSKENTIAIGLSLSDISMFEFSGTSITFSNTSSTSTPKGGNNNEVPEAVKSKCSMVINSDYIDLTKISL